MIYRIISTSILVIVFSFPLKSQIAHEVKLELPLLFSSQYQVNYEFMTAQRLGIEFEFRYDLSDIILYEYLSAGIAGRYAQSAYEPKIGLKYYFSKKDPHYTRFNMGVVAGYYYLIDRDQAYYEAYETENGKEASARLKEQGVIKRIIYGIQAGYKWLIKDSWVIEGQVYMVVEDLVGTHDFEGINLFNMDAYVKLGYRF